MTTGNLLREEHICRMLSFCVPAATGTGSDMEGSQGKPNGGLNHMNSYGQSLNELINFY